MAGSLQHVLDGWSLIENMGDAQEAVHELMYLVLSEIGEEKALNILDEKYYPICRGNIDKDDVFTRVDNLMDEQ
jgi:hypothetical protein